ncbi:hypothetical protein [Massilia aquatica]|uniref:EGF-like domain-containing protein n=1 Tax=Massilia aquatica TaxID=2609000 RepID=A0ABX0M875_9BURK|nr:hypothetical protein [Massilia aquatica]NHZ39799.1 hypothetical protein [Massilia aquatica]
MKAIFVAVAVFAGLLLASVWSKPRQMPGGPGLTVQRSDKPCPANSHLAGPNCVCPDATSWTGAECMQVWSNSNRNVAAVAPPQPSGAKSRQVGTY